MDRGGVHKTRFVPCFPVIWESDLGWTHSDRQPAGMVVCLDVASEAQGCLEALDNDHQAAALVTSSGGLL